MIEGVLTLRLHLKMNKCRNAVLVNQDVYAVNILPFNALQIIQCVFFSQTERHERRTVNLCFLNDLVEELHEKSL